MSVVILRGDAASLPLADGSVDLIVTSPPYWALRDYRDGSESLKGQIGNEETWQEYLGSLLECTREWVRVLKPEGSIFVVLGDKYSDRGHGPNRGRGTGRGPQAVSLKQTRGPLEKSLLLLPERYRIACVDELGLIARAVIEWDKPNPMPESVTDRVRRSHEDIVHLAKSPRYYSAVDEVREPHTMKPQRRPNGRPGDRTPRQGQPRQAWSTARRDEIGVDGHPLGKLPGSVWEIATVPLIVPEWLEHEACCGGRKRPGCEEGLDHHAAFPPALARKCILGWSPSGICTECGEGRRPVMSSVRTFDGQPRSDLPAWADASAPRRTPNGAGHWRFGTDRTMNGYACACPQPNAPTRPAVVLDPFGGTGTTSLVADMHGRTGITIDRSADYCRIAQWRTADPAERARALGVPKPPPVPDGQGALFDSLEGEAS